MTAELTPARPASGCGSAPTSGSTTAAGRWSAARRCGCCGCKEPAPALARGDVLEVVGPRPPAPSPSGCSPPTWPAPVLDAGAADAPSSPSWCRSATGPTGSTGCSPGSPTCRSSWSTTPRATRRRSPRSRRGTARALVALTDNVGPAGARNAGIAEVRTPYVAFVDSDVVVDAAALRGLAGHFADPQVAAVGPRVQGVARSAEPRRFERWDVDGLSLDLGDGARAGAAVVQGRLAAERLPGRAGRRPRGRAPSTTAAASARTSTWSGG